MALLSCSVPLRIGSSYAILSTAMHKFAPGFHYLVILSRSAAEAKNPVFAFQERDSSAFGLRMTNAIFGMNLRIGVLSPFSAPDSGGRDPRCGALGGTIAGPLPSPASRCAPGGYCPGSRGNTAFVTNDRQLTRLTPVLDIIILDDFALP
jgi:hypothetical protein